MLFTRFALAALIASSCAMTYAGPLDRPEPGPHRMPPCQTFQRIAGLDALHESLALTPAQEPAWQQFAQAIKPVPNSGDRAAFEKLSAPARAEKAAEAATRHAKAVKAFYGVLTPAQRKVMDHYRPFGGPAHHDCDMGFKRGHNPEDRPGGDDFHK